jgi:putative spermidine/putrescine transport system ATP-binding protein
VLSQGLIEQIAAPGEIYDSPATPFVAEFVGTMNRLEGTVADDGIVVYGDKRLAITAVRGRMKGERVMVLVRPESVELQPANGDGAGVITGEIVSHTFLGAMMRLKLTSGDNEVTADVPATRANAFPVGMKVQARFPGETARVLTLEPPPTANPDGR